jgi:hypothetical protein
MRDRTIASVALTVAVSGLSALGPDSTRQCSVELTDSAGVSVTIPKVSFWRFTDGQGGVGIPLDDLARCWDCWPDLDEWELAAGIKDCVEYVYHDVYLPPVSGPPFESEEPVA